MMEILNEPTIQYAGVGGLILSVCVGFLSPFLVIRKMNFFSEGLAHLLMTGVALGLFLQVTPWFVGLPFLLVMAIAMLWIQNKSKLSWDSVIGVLFSLGVAGSAFLIQLAPGRIRDLHSYLFGSLIGFQRSDLWVSALCFLIIGFSSAFFWRTWTIQSLSVSLSNSDRTLKGHPSQSVKGMTLHEVVFVMNVAVWIAIASHLIGVLLVSAFLIIPASISKLVSQSMRQMAVVTGMISVFSFSGGFLVGIALDMPPGPVMVGLLGLMFFLVLMLPSRLKNW